MGCASCATSSEVAFMLTVYVEDQDRTVEAEFCSSECLKQWTCDDCVPPSEWTWGVSESAEDDPGATPPETANEQHSPAENEQQPPAEHLPAHLESESESESTLARMY